jgi:hypothetical protein
MVDSGFIFVMGVILIVSLIMTAAFFILNGKLEEENRDLKERINEHEKRKKK